MAPFDNAGCDATGNPLKTLRKVIDKDNSIVRERNTVQHGPNLGSSMRSDRPLVQTETQDMNAFINQKPELQSTPVASASESWATQFNSLHQPVATETLSISRHFETKLAAKPASIYADATVPWKSPPGRTYIIDDPLHGRTATTLAPFKSGAYNAARGGRKQAPTDRASHNQPLQSNRILSGQERIIDYVNKRIFPCEADWVREADPTQYGIEKVDTSGMPEPGSYERPQSSNELIIIADSSAYRDDSAPDIQCDSGDYSGRRHRTRHGPDHQDFQRNLLRCHRDLLCKKSSFFRDLVSQTGKLETVVLNDEPEEVVIGMINFVETGRLRSFEYLDVWSGGNLMTLPDHLHYARFYVALYAAGITYGIPDLADAAYAVLNNEDICISGPDHTLESRWEPLTKVLLEDIYELEEKFGQPTIELRKMFLYRHASKIMQLRNSCDSDCDGKSCKDGQCESELMDLRTRFPTFHGDLYEALLQVKEDYEEVVEDFKGDWTIRYREQGRELRSKL